MKILVAGGAGFLGAHLCARLVEENHHVICVDNFFTGRMRNLHNLTTLSNFEVLEQDITEPFHLEVDQIYNLACPASPPHYQFDPVKTTVTSVLGTINLLELAKESGARLLLASTSEVYGDPLEHPQKESYRGNVSTTGIRACYDEGKRCAETLCFDYHRKHGVDIKVQRIFNTYGPGMDVNDGRVVSNFITQAITGRDITIYGDGTQTRSFCYVTDQVRGMHSLMQSDVTFTGPVNIGNPDEFSMLELAQKVIDLTGSNSGLIFKPLPQDDPLQRCPDISLAKKQLDWSPTVDLHDGLVETIEYFKRALGYD